MAYTKTTWVDGTTPINATNLNKIEQGIDNAHKTVTEEEHVLGDNVGFTTDPDTRIVTYDMSSVFQDPANHTVAYEVEVRTTTLASYGWQFDDGAGNGLWAVIVTDTPVYYTAIEIRIGYADQISYTVDGTILKVVVDSAVSIPTYDEAFRLMAAAIKTENPTAKVLYNIKVITGTITSGDSFLSLPMVDITGTLIHGGYELYTGDPASGWGARPYTFNTESSMFGGFLDTGTAPWSFDVLWEYEPENWSQSEGMLTSDKSYFVDTQQFMTNLQGIVGYNTGICQVGSYTRIGRYWALCINRTFGYRYWRLPDGTYRPQGYGEYVQGSYRNFYSLGTVKFVLNPGSFGTGPNFRDRDGVEQVFNVYFGECEITDVEIKFILQKLI